MTNYSQYAKNYTEGTSIISRDLEREYNPNPLRKLIEDRISELRKDIKKHLKNGAHSSARKCQKQINKNVEILFSLEQNLIHSGNYYPRIDDFKDSINDY